MKRRPCRIQLRRTKGYKKPRRAIVVSRPTKWGNPWQVGKHGDRASCLHQFKQFFIAGALSVTPAMARAELRGRDLACWCPLPKDGEADICHAATLLAVANDAGEAGR